MAAQPDIQAVIAYFESLQRNVCQTIEAIDGTALFSIEEIETPGGGRSRPRVLDNGAHIERGAVQFTHSIGQSLPPAASERNPHLAGKGFQATAVSMIMHPRNPFVPTFHANLRFFLIDSENWYFGGGFDLTPYYPFREDVVHWHQTAKAACDPFGHEIYPKFKAWCDDYFFLPHRNEPRGIGGLFYDDLNEWGFEKTFGFMQAVGNAYLKAYVPIVHRNKDKVFGERERQWQLYRRGRYVEFNLVFDRGTLFGLQSNGRTEAILMSLPPLVRWEYGLTPEAGTPEAELLDYYLKPRDWV